MKRARAFGLRLTAWELGRAGVPVTAIPDSAAAWPARGHVDVAVVGADRIAANGDSANKIGTYRWRSTRGDGIPLYVAAPVSTIDLGCRTDRTFPLRNATHQRFCSLAGLAPRRRDRDEPAFDTWRI